MKLAALVLALAGIAGLAGCAKLPPPKSAAAIALWRLDCGQYDIDDLEGRGRVLMPVSCYLVRRGDELILFDAGLSEELKGRPLREQGQTLRLDRTLAEQLAQIGIDPVQVTTVIVSHYHGDHHSQAGLFPKARLLIGAGDAAALRGARDKGALTPWIGGKRPVEEISADRDLHGDGRLVVLHTPGHTPGHLSMLVKLRDASYILTGDLVHQRPQLAAREPSGNHVDKVRGKTEIGRVLALAEETGATIIVGHEVQDIGLLPAFPAAAR